MTRVLYIHHVGAMGGSARSLIEMIRAFPEGSVKPVVVTKRGPVVSHFREAGAEVIEALGIAKFDNTAHTYYRGLRWLILGREAIFAAFTWQALRRARSVWEDVDVVHVNDSTNLVAIILARSLFCRPVVVHCRALQRVGVNNWQTRLVRWGLQRFASAVICIDQTVQGTLPAGIPSTVIHNGLHRPPGEEAVRRHSASDGRRLVVGIVGGLFRTKGVHEFVDAAHLCTQRGLDIEYVMVGDAPSDRPRVLQPLLRWLKLEQNVREEIHDKIREYELGDRLKVSGFTADVADVYRTIDVLCFPSHLNGVGRPVIEAAFYGVPSIVAIDHPKPDTFVDHQTGLRIDEQDPEGLARAIEVFHKDRSEVDRMGRQARALALENFDTRKNARRLIELYWRLLDSSGGTSVRPSSPVIREPAI